MRLGIAGVLVAIVGLWSCARTQPAEELADASAGDGGVTPLPASDGGRGGRTVGPVRCPVDPSTCTTAETVLLPAFDAPPGVDFRQARGGWVLAFDAPAARFVLYGARVQVSGQVLAFSEILRFEGTVDRVTLGPDGALACAGLSCELITEPLARIAVPKPLLATTFTGRADGPCVGGNGIACLHEGAFTNVLRGTTMAGTVSAFSFLPLDQDVLIATASDTLVRVDPGGTVTPVRVAGMETLLSLEATQGVGYTQVWAGRSRTGHLFVGDENGGQRCPLRVDDLQLEDYSSVPLRFLYGGRLVAAVIRDATNYPSGCTAVDLPPAILGHAFTRCGVAGAFVVFEAHRIYTTLGSCAAG